MLQKGGISNQKNDPTRISLDWAHSKVKMGPKRHTKLRMKIKELRIFKAPQHIQIKTHSLPWAAKALK